MDDDVQTDPEQEENAKKMLQSELRKAINAFNSTKRPVEEMIKNLDKRRFGV